MIYEIIWNNPSINYLNKLDFLIKNRIIKKIEHLANNFSYHNLRRIHSSNYHRLRIGNYRVILDIKKSIKILKVLKVGHRKNIYKN